MAKQYKIVKLPDGGTAIAARVDGDKVLPIVFDADAPENEDVIDAIQLSDEVVPNLREQRKKVGKRVDELEEVLKPYITGTGEDGKPQFIDIEAAKKAMSLAKQLEQKKLIDSGEKDSVIKSMAEDFEQRMNSAQSNFQKELSAREQKIAEIDSKYEAYRIREAFSSSIANPHGFLGKRTSIRTPEAATRLLGEFFYLDRETDTVRGKLDGKPVYSDNQKTGSDLADTEEALGKIFPKLSFAADFLKGTSDAGGNARSPAGSSGQNRSRNELYMSGLGI
jgi:hypothetical protein